MYRSNKNMFPHWSACLNLTSHQNLPQYIPFWHPLHSHMNVFWWSCTIRLNIISTALTGCSTNKHIKCCKLELHKCNFWGTGIAGALFFLWEWSYEGGKKMNIHIIGSYITALFIRDGRPGLRKLSFKTTASHLNYRLLSGWRTRITCCTLAVG